MLERILQLNLWAKILPAALVLYMFVGFAGTTSINTATGMEPLCERSYDFGSFAGAIVALIGAVFLLRIAKQPRTVREQSAATGHRVVAGILAVLAVALVFDGLATRTSTSTPQGCQEISNQL